MKSDEIRKKFLDFFEKKGHKIVPSTSLVPENDPSVLFTTAGMQQFKPYYIGVKDAKNDFGTLNTVSIQKCVRTSDIDEVGDESHLTFFEMLGNFSFGGYFKKEAIEYAYEFITKEIGLTIDYVSIFEGEGEIPPDTESENIWKSIDSNMKVMKAGRADNFWGPTGDEGPCGPTTEVYVNGMEIWNIVFNEYYQNKDKKLEKLKTPGVDTGMGLERLLVQAQKKNNVYETDLFNNEKTKEDRIVADHVKAALFMISDGVIPSNTGAGYILRRLIRRAVRFSKTPLINEIEKIKKIYKGVYDLDDKEEIQKEENKFKETLNNGLKEFESGIDPFTLFTTYGFPIELTLELAKEKGITIDLNDFEKKMFEHRKLSQSSSVGMFKGGLANHEEATIKLHTAHHLLLSALQEVLGKEVKQKGSNITEERLRMDFSSPQKLTPEEIWKVEEIVNKRIEEDLPVIRREMPLIEAESLGAEMEFGAKYPEIVSLYFIEDKKGNAISKEFCGGPHVERTGILGKFIIQKEEAVSAGVRRIKATLTNSTV